MKLTHVKPKKCPHPQEYIARAKPLLAIDNILHLDECMLIAEKKLHINEFYFPGHYPNYAIYPGVFVVESILQAAEIYLHHYIGVAKLIEISNRFLSEVRPDTTVQFHLRFSLQEDARRVKVIGKCLKQKQEAAQAKLLFKVEV